MPGGPEATSSPRARLLLIDDDVRLADMVVQYLGSAGYTVEHRPDATTGLEAVRAWTPDAVLLDLGLPDADGLDVCRELRALPDPAGRTPVLMLTARGETTDRVVGLEMGADDYLPKPFEPRELLARVRALIRRAEPVRGAEPARGAGVATVPAPLPAEGVLRFGRLEIDLDARRVRIAGQDRELTAYQFDLLVALARHAGRVLSREQLMNMVKGEALEAFDRSIDVHVGRIRQAIEDDPKSPRRVLTVRGAGYLLARQQDGV